ncbi:MAG: dihydroorotase [Defluviitaleaceae bacterium]|nr:dihydroorotase [Defluviitaleaceae bacterium]
MKRVFVKNGHVIDPKNKIDEKKNIFIENGKIICEQKNFCDAEIIDATGMWVVPGLIDMHVHLRDPGQLHKETIRTGTLAAAAGGFTTVCCMPNTSPVIDNAKTVEYIIEQAATKSPIRVIPVGSITKNLDGEEISPFHEMCNKATRAPDFEDFSGYENSHLHETRNICAISDDGKTVANKKIFFEAMIRAKKLNLPILAHCEEEVEIIARDLILARETGAQLHICHVSTKRGVELIREAKKNGQRVTAEAAPHHFALTRNEENKNDTNFKMSPPLRNADDRDAIISGLRDGTIDVIATDHAPHSEAEKNLAYEFAPNGIIGLETAVPIAITHLVKQNFLTPFQLIEKFTANPAKILALDLGHLSENAAADVTIIDPNEKFFIDKNNFKSLSRNTPFHGFEVFGRVNYTICKGEIFYAR